MSGKGSLKSLFDNLQVLFRFADDEEQPVPGAYIEFAERAPLPQFAHLPVCDPLFVFYAMFYVSFDACLTSNLIHGRGQQ